VFRGEGNARKCSTNPSSGVVGAWSRPVPVAQLGCPHLGEGLGLVLPTYPVFVADLQGPYLGAGLRSLPPTCMSDGQSSSVCWGELNPLVGGAHPALSRFGVLGSSSQSSSASPYSVVVVVCA